MTFGLFSGTKGDYSDMWMIEITIKTNEIDMDVFFFQKYITYKSHDCPQSPAFPISSLVYEFKTHRQTMYHKYMETYLPLKFDRKIPVHLTVSHSLCHP